MEKPIHTDQYIRSLLNQAILSEAFLVAYDLGFFEYINNFKKTKGEIALACGISERSTQTLLSVCVNSTLIEFNDPYYTLSEYAKEYLVSSSPYYFGNVLDLAITNREVRSFKNIKETVLSNKPQIYDDKDLFEMHDRDHDYAIQFVEAMHQKSAGSKQAWPRDVDFSFYNRLLDIGGGLGTHAISACLQWPTLSAIILERPSICSSAEKMIEKFELSARIHTVSGDMWQDHFPAADIHFYSDIFHDWPVGKCQMLAKKSFLSLPPGGMILLHEMLYNPDKCSPTNTVAYNLNMFLWSEGQQFTAHELQEILKLAGFTHLFHQMTFGDWGLVGGIKPDQ